MAAAAAPASTAFRGFVLSNNRYTKFDVPGATTKTVVGGSNDRGQLVGFYTQTGVLDDPNSPRRGYLLDHGRFVRIDFPDAVDTQTLGIDNRGQIVGSAYRDPAAKLPRLFTQFDRLGAEHSEVQGTGMGLVLAKRLAAARGGALTVDSVEGQGTTFTLELSPAMEPA